MQYKTIILELLKQRPDMHEQLRQERKLLRTLEIYARELKQVSSEAFEMALKELEDRLPPASQAAEQELTHDQAMEPVTSPSRRG
jgi:hypothetical protein